MKQRDPWLCVKIFEKKQIISKCVGEVMSSSTETCQRENESLNPKHLQPAPAERKHDAIVCL